MMNLPTWNQNFRKPPAEPRPGDPPPPPRRLCAHEQQWPGLLLRRPAQGHFPRRLRQGVHTRPGEGAVPGFFFLGSYSRGSHA